MPKEYEYTRRNRDYTEEDKANVLAAYEACRNFEQTARDTGVPVSTVKNWCYGGAGAPDPTSVQHSKNDLRNLFMNLIHAYGIKAFELVEEGKVSLRDLNGGMHLLYEKIALMDGDATSRVEHTVDKLTPEQRQKAKEAIIDDLRSKPDEQPQQQVRRLEIP